MRKIAGGKAGAVEAAEPALGLSNGSAACRFWKGGWHSRLYTTSGASPLAYEKISLA